MWQIVLFLGIFGNSIFNIYSPVEHIRTRMQVQTTSAGGKPQYSSTFDCFQKIKSQYGLAGIYKGQYVTFLREFQGNAF